MLKAKQRGNRVVTGEVRLSYCHLFEPYAMNPTDTPKYSVAILISKKDTSTIEAVERAIQEAELKKWGNKIPKNLRSPLRDGDEERPDDANYAGCYYINAKTKTKPQLVNKHMELITDSSEIYSGCYARASVSFYGYDMAGNKGVGCGLGNIQKIRDGENLGGAASAMNDFDLIEDEDSIF